MLTLYWWPRTRAFRVVWMLEELGADYELRPLDIDSETARNDPAFRAVSPLGKVPALADGEARVADSAAICLYLADRFPASGLAPASDDPARGGYLWWMFFAPSVMEPCMAEKFNGWTANHRAHGWGDFDSMLAALEQGVVPGPWLLGDRFGAADVMVGSSAWYMRQFGLLPTGGPIEAYIERCIARPTWRRAEAREQAVAAARA